MQATLITPSYFRDYNLCAKLCETVDKYASEDIKHKIIVDNQSDYELFSKLANTRRTIHFAKDVLDASFFKIPFMKKLWFTPISLKPVRGWILQQLIKLSIPNLVEDGVAVYTDSDIRFVRPFDSNSFAQDGRVYLNRIPGAAQLDTHKRWHRTAAYALGLEEKDYFGSDYIDNAVTWHVPTIKKLQQHISDVHGKSWLKVMSNQLHFSEYILYGIYVEHVIGLENSAHIPRHESLCHNSWDYKLDNAEDVENFANNIKPHHVAVLVQSNLGYDDNWRKHIFDSVNKQIGSSETHSAAQ